MTHIDTGKKKLQQILPRYFFNPIQNIFLFDPKFFYPIQNIFLSGPIQNIFFYPIQNIFFIRSNTFLFKIKMGKSINVRYLGIVRSHLKNQDMRQQVLIFILSRTIKNQIRHLLRSIERSKIKQTF